MRSILIICAVSMFLSGCGLIDHTKFDGYSLVKSLKVGDFLTRSLIHNETNQVIWFTVYEVVTMNGEKITLKPICGRDYNHGKILSLSSEYDTTLFLDDGNYDSKKVTSTTCTEIAVAVGR